MKFIFKKYLLTVTSLFILTQVIAAFKITNSWQGFFYSALILGLFFTVVRPIINLIMLPINLLTLNLFSWIIQLVLFYLWTMIVGVVKISAWQFPGFSFGPITLSEVYLIKWQVVVVSAFAYILIYKLLAWIFK